jgi:DNA polymerase (family X)
LNSANAEVVRIFNEIADLLEIKGANPFKIRAYRNGAESIADLPEPLVRLSDEDLRKVPAIGKDLAAKIREILDTGGARYHQDLLEEFPPTILDLLRLQGVGPKTVALLYSTLDIRTLQALEDAAQSGRLRALKGMGAKKEALILKALDERRRHTGRHLLADAMDAAAAIVGHLRDEAPDADLIPVGSMRRGCETCGDIDILAIGESGRGLMDRFASYRLVDRVLARGETKSSVLLRGGIQADLRLVAKASRGAAMQYFTGSKAHNIALRDRAIQRGLKLNEYGVFRVQDNVQIAGEDEEGVYRALGLAWIPPELREHRGEIDAAEGGALPVLIDERDVRGDLHMHTDATDGRDSLETMVAAARAAGLEYIAITDHSKALAMSNGLDEARALEHAARIRALDAQVADLTVLAGIECDIRADGELDLDRECLAALDLVVASVHSAFNQDEEQMTSRVLRAIESPVVDVIGHPTGRLLLKRDGYRLDMARVIEAAARTGTALEINSHVDRMDLNDAHARQARDRGAPLVISTDSHAQSALAMRRWGVIVARRAGLTAADVLNTRPVAAFRASLRRARGARP